MNPKIKIVSIVAITTLLLVGCANTKQDNKQQTYHKLSGRVADGYIAGARVCLDTNQNGICDSNEPYAITSQNGKFNFIHLTNKQINSSLVVQITKQSIDTDNNKAVKIPFVMLAPKKSTFISPLTTLIACKMQLGDSLISAMVDVSKKTGVSLLYVDGNFMKSNTLAAKKAKFAAKIIAKTTQLVIKKLIKNHTISNIFYSINATRYINWEIFNHSIILKRFLSTISKQNSNTVKTDAVINKLSNTIISNLSDYKTKIASINKNIQKEKRKKLATDKYNQTHKSAHNKSDDENTGAIIFVLTLQLFFFVFLAFFL